MLDTRLNRFFPTTGLYSLDHLSSPVIEWISDSLGRQARFGLAGCFHVNNLAERKQIRDSRPYNWNGLAQETGKVQRPMEGGPWVFPSDFLTFPYARTRPLLPAD